MREIRIVFGLALLTGPRSLGLGHGLPPGCRRRQPQFLAAAYTTARPKAKVHSSFCLRCIDSPARAPLGVDIMSEVPSPDADIAARQAKRLQEAVENLFACCQARIAMQSERFGLPPAALRALLALGENRYLAPGELGRRLGVTKSRVTAVATQLLRHGLIDKHPDPADARVTLLSLTPAGRRARDDVRAFMAGLFQSMMERVEPAQREAVLTSLDVLRHCMEAARQEISA